MVDYIKYTPELSGNWSKALKHKNKGITTIKKIIRVITTNKSQLQGKYNLVSK